MKKVLFIHQNFPAQFIHLANFLKKSYHVQSMSYSNKHILDIPHHKCVCERGNTPNIHYLALEFETKTLRAETTLAKCRELYNTENYYPDIIIAHSGWGESLLLKTLWPNTKIINYMELFFDNSTAKLITRNAAALISLTNSDALVSPTIYQRNTYPKIFHDKIQVIFEGINTNKFKRLNIDGIKIGLIKEDRVIKWRCQIIPDSAESGSELEYEKIYNIKANDKIITFISRDLTPTRGYDTFMESLPQILEQNPDTYVIIVGGDGNSYTEPPSNGGTYQEIYFNKIKSKIKDTSKIFFLGRLPQKNLIEIMSISSIHIYITIPITLSWSFLEALSTSVLMVSVDNEPVNHVIKNNYNGVLLKENSYVELGNKVNYILKYPEQYEYLRDNARKTAVENYDLYNICIPKYVNLIESLLS